MSMSINRTKNLTVTAILAAVSAVLMFFSINIPLMPSFIKLDLSELPAIFGAFVLGPIHGVIVCLVKNIVNLFFSTTGGVGELSNFMLGVSFVLPAGWIFKRLRSKKGAILGAIIGAVAMALLSVVTNYFIVYPIYFNFMPLEAILGLYHIINPFVGTQPTSENLLKALLAFNMPFTFLKGMLCVVITAPMYRLLAPVIYGKMSRS